ncbi:ferrochelatase [Thermosulfidibacter takaii]|nr:ferrochelatase [Thermosulfidibacter takaii]
MKLVLVNTGGVTSFKSYPFFLFRMFTDKCILPLPKALRTFVAANIAFFRVPFAYRKYLKIGGSPVLGIMEEQKEDLARLSQQEVLLGCLYSEPLLDNILKLEDELILIPQFPQYSKTTYGCIIDRLARYNKKSVKIAPPYYSNKHFIGAWVTAINKVYNREHLLFVAHGIPERTLAKGDPYYSQVLETASLVSDELDTNYFTVAFQSRLGPFPWVKPYVEDALKDIAKRGIKEVVVTPISFTNEHLETLYDLDIELKNLAKELGFTTYKRVKVPYNSPLLYQAWIDAAKEAKDWQQMLL